MGEVEVEVEVGAVVVGLEANLGAILGMVWRVQGVRSSTEGARRSMYIFIYIYEWVRPPAVDPTRIRAQSDCCNVGADGCRWRRKVENGGPEGWISTIVRQTILVRLASLWDK